MSMLLLLSIAACTAPPADDTEPSDTDTDTDTDADADADADTDTWSPGTAEVILATGSRIQGVWLFDQDGDGYDDLVTSELYAEAVDGVTDYQLRLSVRPALGDGTFGSAIVTESTEGGKNQQPSMVDLDGDGQLDALAIHRELGFSTFLGSPDGFGAESFTEIAAGDYPMSVGAADLDGDDVPEVALVIQTTTGTRVDVFTRDAVGDYSVAWTLPITYFLLPQQLIAVDLDGDGHDTLVFGTSIEASSWDFGIQVSDTYGTDVLSVERIEGLRLSDDSVMFGYGSDGDGDGAEELISVNVDGLQLYDREVGHPTVLRLNSFEDYYVGVTGFDLNSDGSQDVLELLSHSVVTDTGGWISARLSWTLADGDGFADPAFVDYDIYPAGAYAPPAVAAGNIDGDGCVDVVFVSGDLNARLARGVCGD